MKPVWIELVNSGVANRFEYEDEEVIEMNWRLTLHPELYHQIYKHEIGHNEGNFTFKDFKHDMMSRTPGLLKFMIKYPSTFTQALPIYWDRRKKRFIYDYSTIASWIMMISITVGIYHFLRWLI